MKKLILILFCIFSLDTLTYCSFPIAESPTEQLSESNTEASVSDFFEFPTWSKLHWIFKALIFLIAFAVAVSVLYFGVLFFIALTHIVNFFQEN